MTPRSPTPRSPSAAERARLAALARYRVLGTPPEAVFDRFVRLAAGVVSAPMALIGLTGRRWCTFKARVGVGADRTPYRDSLCDPVFLARGPLLVPRTDTDSRFSSTPLVRDERVRMYLGAPLVSPDGFHLGVLAVLDTRVRAAPKEAQQKLLSELAAGVMEALEARLRALEQTERALEGQRYAELLGASPAYALTATPEGRLVYANRSARDALSLKPNDPLPQDLGAHPRWSPKAFEEVVSNLRGGAALCEAVILLPGSSASSPELLEPSPPEANLPKPNIAEDAPANAPANPTTEALDDPPAARVTVQTVLAHRSADGKLEHVSVLAREFEQPPGPGGEPDQRELRRAEVLELIARGAPLPAALLHLARFLETACPGLLASVSLLREGKLYTEVAPNLPSSYVRLLEGLPIGPSSGACAAAAETAQRVLSPDIRTDPIWHNLRFVTLQHGLQAAWSEPILDTGGEVLGTFALFCREVRYPTPSELRLLREAAQLAAVAVSRQKLYARLQKQAYFDPLTGLPNRLLMRDRLEQMLLRAERKHEAVAVLLLDLNDFKKVNDSLGHSAGDLLLQAVAARLQGSLRVDDTVARIGGDEFVLLSPLVCADDAAEVARKVMAAFAEPFKVRERTFEVAASIGVSLYPFDGQDLEGLVKAADSAMYAAKADARAGLGGGYRLYQQAMTDLLEVQLQLEAGLRQALEREEFRVHFQPRFDLGQEKALSFEALVRWQHPEHGMLAPGRFLEVAERAGLLSAIDEWVLTQVVEQLGRWRQEGVGYLLSCNLSASSFRREGLIGRLGRALRHYEVDPGRLELEVTENLLMRDLGGVSEQLRDLKLRLPGVRIAIDDFGSGYSSLAYLRHLPIDTLKIDRAFVKDLDHTESRLQRTALAVIRTVISLGRDLGFRVVAEGAETEAQLGMLTALGIDEVQGYIVGRPAPLHVFMPAEAMHRKSPS